MDEKWKSVIGFEGFYEVSSFGSVRSLDRVVSSGKRENQRIKGRALKPGVASNGYFTVALSRDGVSRSYTIHELVCYAFIGPRPEGWVVDHMDRDRKNNKVENLRYVTQTGNMRNISKANSASGVLGVYRNGKGWMAQINYEGRQRHLGTFPTIERAADARKCFELAIGWREVDMVRNQT